MRRHRERRKNGIWCVRLRMSEPVARLLTERGFLAAGRRADADVERALYGMLEMVRTQAPDVRRSR
jgi:hypothetical protein